MTSTHPFSNLDDYIAQGRISGLALSPDGTRVVTTVATLNDKRTGYTSSLWELDPEGQRPARRLTFGEHGESSPSFTADGDLLFTSRRGNGDAAAADIWLLPRSGGEARQMATRVGGFQGVRAARSGDTVIGASPVLRAAKTLEDDERLRKQRKDTAVTAILHTGYPVRHWDHDLGRDATHLLNVAVTTEDLTPDASLALEECSWDISSDGSFLVSSWNVAGPLGSMRVTLVRIDARSGERTTIVDDRDGDVYSPAISADGRFVAYLHETHSAPESAPVISLRILDRATGQSKPTAPQWDRWPSSVTWAADGTLLVTADDAGRAPIFRVDPATDTVVALTADDYAYTNVTAAPDGSVYALRSSYAAAPHVVRVADVVTELPSPVEPVALPGQLTEITATAEDGSPLRAWLALPNGDAPAPLLLWVHGGPLGSWNAWSWRWNPWLLVEQGYAVLLPDPALSTGYGQAHIQRGWGAWGGPVFTDLMAITDVAQQHDRVDETRSAAMGGSFGGYMANWIAGHTDRFDAIVTHASLWALDQFGPTTDGAYFWQREMTPEMAVDNSPHLFVADIRTPMLVIHGDKDYRVPIGEGLRLWYELLSESGLPADDDGNTEHRFLYFPDENHWVLSPQHAKIWYQSVIAFLADHIVGQQATWPEVLG